MRISYANTFISTGPRKVNTNVPNWSSISFVMGLTWIFNAKIKKATDDKTCSYKYNYVHHQSHRVSSVHQSYAEWNPSSVEWHSKALQYWTLDGICGVYGIHNLIYWPHWLSSFSSLPNTWLTKCKRWRNPNVTNEISWHTNSSSRVKGKEIERFVVTPSPGWHPAHLLSNHLRH